MASYRFVKRGLPLLAAFLLLLSACNLPFASPTAPLPGAQGKPGGAPPGGPGSAPSPGEPGGPPPGQPPGGSSAVQISFAADRAQINLGECVTLTWQVSGPHFAVLLEGEPVPDQGSKQVCPPESHTFFLQVDTGEKMEERSVAIQIEASAALPPSSGGGGTPVSSSGNAHIWGRVFTDQNRNGMLDSGEPPYTALSVIYLYAMRPDGACDENHTLASATVNAQGEFDFTVAPGLYCLMPIGSGAMVCPSGDMVGHDGAEVIVEVGGDVRVTYGVQPCDPMTDPACRCP